MKVNKRLLKIDEATAIEIATNFLTHGKRNVVRCSAVLKEDIWQVEVILEKPRGQRELVKIDAGTGKIVNNPARGNHNGLKIVAIAVVGIYGHVAHIFGHDDSPIQSATSIMNMVCPA